MFSRWKNEQAHFSLVTLCVLAIATSWGSAMKIHKCIFAVLALRMFHVKHLRCASNLKFLSLDPFTVAQDDNGTSCPHQTSYP